MSTQTKSGKLISRLEIGFDDETKASIAALQASLGKITQSMGVSGGLLAAMQTPANDAQNKKTLSQADLARLADNFIHGAVDADGEAWGYEHPPVSPTELGVKAWNADPHWHCSKGASVLIGGGYDASNWRDSLISRETVNDVDYLSASESELNGMTDDQFIDDELLDIDAAPKITDNDLQAIFIKNLSTGLIQRMHSMDRFSEDDYAIGGDKLKPWDIVFYEPLNTYAVLTSCCKPTTSSLLFLWDGKASAGNWRHHSYAFKLLRTITEDELPAFREALEACYV